jgi:hypothetical protein
MVWLRPAALQTTASCCLARLWQAAGVAHVGDRVVHVSVGQMWGTCIADCKAGQRWLLLAPDCI